jgi:diaminopimelate decarboxylase
VHAIRSLVAGTKDGIKRILRPIMARSAGNERQLTPGHWGLTVTDGMLSVEGTPLMELRARWGSPLHIVHDKRLRNNAQRFLAVPPGCDAGCEVYYSYKTNPVPGVLARLHQLGFGAEVISHYELWLARQLGVPAHKIVYNGPAKSERSMREAIEAGVGMLNVNHREEIPVVVRAAEAVGRRLRVGVRVAVSGGWSAQFGVPMAEGLAAYQAARQSPLLDRCDRPTRTSRWHDPDRARARHVRGPGPRLRR